MSATPPTLGDRLRLDAGRGAWLDQDRRYVLMRADALMGLFAELPVGARSAALDALARSVLRHGGASVAAYHAMDGDRDGLMRVVADTAAQLGWGVWTFARDDTGLRLAVENSPFAAGFGASDTPVCHAIKGLLQAVSETVMKAPTHVTEVVCAATGAPCCRFEALAATPNSTPSQP